MASAKKLKALENQNSLKFISTKGLISYFFTLLKVLSIPHVLL